MYSFCLVLLIFAQFSDTKFCDDGKTGIEIDLHGEKDWKCETEKWKDISMVENSISKCYKEGNAYHVCIDKTIDDKYPDRIPNRGPHREVWGKYGEYNYLPPGRYVHNIEHGGVVFMYHPCVPDSMINMLRRIAVTCLNRHIITAFRNLTKEYPIAVVTYGCVYQTNVVNSTAIKQWVRSQFVQNPSPEANEYKDGRYDFGLINPSHNVKTQDTADTYCIDTDMDKTPLLLPTKPPSTIKIRSTVLA